MVGGDSGRATPFLRRHRPSAIPNHQPRRNATYHSREAVQTTEASSTFPVCQPPSFTLLFGAPTILRSRGPILVSLKATRALRLIYRKLTPLQTTFGLARPVAPASVTKISRSDYV